MNIQIKAEIPVWFIAMLFVFALICGLANGPAWLTAAFVVIGAGLAVAR